MGNNKASGAADITIASIQSLLSKDRIKKFNPEFFKLVLVDEAHHAVSPSYREALRHFGLADVTAKSPVLVGVSATFFRLDGLKLGAAIDHIVYHKDYVDMIGEKWLSDAVFTTVKSGVNLSRVHKDKFGDFAVKQLSAAVNTETTNNITVRAWLANAADRKSTLVFCVDIDHVKQLTATFREHGIDARYITAVSTSNTRNEELQAFKRQEYPVLVNCGLFTEGTDIPNVDCVLLARPTRSKGLLIQMIGRGLRLFPGKTNCHIIDMVASLQAGVISSPTLFGLDPDEVLESADVKQLQRMREELDSQTHSSNSNVALADSLAASNVSVTFIKYDSIFDLLSDEKAELHIRSRSRNAWVRVDENRYMLTDRSGWISIEKSQASPNGLFLVRFIQKFEDSSTGRLVHTRPRVVANAADLEQAVHAADTFAASHLSSFQILLREPWRKSPASHAQLDFLNKKNLRDDLLKPQDLTRGQAADIITKLRFGTRKRFEAARKKKERTEIARMEFEALQRQGEVKVGPLNSVNELPS